MEDPLKESSSSHSIREGSGSSDSCEDFCSLPQLNSSQASQPRELPQAPAAASFYVGQKFSKFEDLEQHLKRYEEQQFVKFWRRDSRTIQAAQKRVNKPIRDQLKYYAITYSCIHGGKKFKARGEGKRSTSTFRKDCNAELKLCASDDGTMLIVRNFCDKHNHPISRELFKQLPQQRKLTMAEQETAKNLLELNANKKMVQDKLVANTGKIVLLKDLSNIKAQLQCGRSRNDLDESIKRLKDTYGASVNVLVNDSNMLMGLFFQDSEMKSIFNSYPELVCIDATYKLLELRFPVYIMLIEDGNGQSEVAAVFLLLEETEQSIKSMIGIFKSHNLQWSATRVLMTDKDMMERDVLSAEFPSAELAICLFHTFRSFRREVVVEKMGITSGQRNLCLELLQQLAYATSEDNYQDIYERFRECAPPTVISYFDKQWHPIRNQWVMGMKYKSGNFLNGTNNRLECINQKLKSVITRYSSLEEFIDKFFLILRVLRSERDHKAALVTQKVPVAYHALTDDVSLSYMKYLTPYAYQFLAKQMELRKKVNLQPQEDGIFGCMSSEGLITVTSTTCQCTSWRSMKLPCRHILTARSKLGMSLYDEALCDKRWSTAYYKLNQRIFSSEQPEQSVSDVEIVQPPPRRKTMSQAEKFKYACRITTKLASLVSESTKDEFTDRCKLLENIVNCWKAGKNVSQTNAFIAEISSKDQSAVSSTDCESEDMLPTSGNETSTTVAGIQVSASIAQVTASDSVVPTSVAELNQDNTSVVEMNQVPTSISMVVECETSPRVECPPAAVHVCTKTSDCCSSKQIKDIVMPPVIKKRGRPKGHEVTVIGLPGKKTKAATKLQPFIKLHTTVKEKAMLSWFVDEAIVEATIKSLGKKLVEEEDVETRPERVPNAILDENVDIYLIRKYFSNDAWLVVTEVVHQKQRNPVYVCKSCHHDLHKQASIICDHCLMWYHIQCTGLKLEPKARHWYCRDCHDCPFT